jgi:hypothetical protein
VDKRRIKFKILVLSHIKKQKDPIIGAMMIAGDLLFQNGGFFAVYHITYHSGQVKELAKAIAKLCRRIPHKIKRRKP